MVVISEKKTGYIQIALILILGLLVYANAVKGSFVWDDHCLVKDNAFIKDSGAVLKIITRDAGAGCGEQTNFYRPVQLLLYWAGYQLWGLDVRGYHFLSIIFHLLAALGIYLVLRLISKDIWFAFLAALLFVVHPVHTEAVAYISGLADPLCFSFILFSLAGYIKYVSSGSKKYFLFSVFSFILALGSKEIAFILPFILLLYHYAFAKKAQGPKLAVFFSITIVYFILRLTFISVLQNTGDYILGWPQRVPAFFAAISGYVKLLFFPAGLHLEYGRKIFSFWDPQVLAGIFLFFSLLSIAFWQRKARPLLFFAIGWFFLALLPLGNIFTLNYSYMMEHWLYIPSFGFFIIAAWLLRKFYEKRGPRFTADLFCGALIAFCLVLTIRQNFTWRDPVSVYTVALKHNPASFRFHNELALEYAQAGQNALAIAHFKSALKIQPQLTGVYQNLVNLYLKAGLPQEAAIAHQKQEELLRRQFRENYVYAQKLRDSGKYARALDAYKRISAEYPDDPQLNTELAQVYVLCAKYDLAIGILKKVIRQNPDYAAAYHVLAVAYYYKKQYRLSREYSDYAGKLGYLAPAGFLELLKAHKK